MRKTLLFALVLLLLPGLAACGAKKAGTLSQPAPTAEGGEGTPLFTFCGEEAEAFEAGFYDDVPVRLLYRSTGEGGPMEYGTEDAETIAAVFEALRAVRVLGPVDMSVTDADDSYTFTRADGSTFGVDFEGGYLNLDGQNYETEGRSALSRLSDDLRGEE